MTKPKKRVTAEQDITAEPTIPATAPTAPLETPQPTFSVQVTAESLWVRSTPEKAEGNQVGKLYSGDSVTVLAQEGDWYKIDKGYIMARFTEPTL